jgi:hypothetical protein
MAQRSMPPAVVLRRSTLGKLDAFGFLEMRTVDRRRVPTPVIMMLHVAIDPYAMTDKIEISPAP